MRNLASSLAGITLMLTSLSSNAELLQVSQDGSVKMPTESIKKYQGNKGFDIQGLVYAKEDGEERKALFVATCGKTGGTLQFGNASGLTGEVHKWSVNGKWVVDAIAITACKYSGLTK